MNFSTMVASVAVLAGLSGSIVGAEQIRTDSSKDLLSQVVKPFDIDSDGRLDSQELNSITDSKRRKITQASYIRGH